MCNQCSNDQGEERRNVSYLLKFGVVPFQFDQIFNPLFVVLMSHQFSVLL